jgi:hypothetical protein
VTTAIRIGYHARFAVTDNRRRRSRLTHCLEPQELNWPPGHPLILLPDVFECQQLWLPGDPSSRKISILYVDA